jgi:hypothetical protein
MPITPDTDVHRLTSVLPEVHAASDVSAVAHQPQHHAPAEEHVVQKHHIIGIPRHSTRSHRPAAAAAAAVCARGGAVSAACVVTVEWRECHVAHLSVELNPAGGSSSSSSSSH